MRANVNIPSQTRPRRYFVFLWLLWMPLLAALLSPQIGPFARNVVHDPRTFDEELNRLRQKTPLWNGAIALYNQALYAIGTSGRPGAAEVGSGGWLFLGDVFNRNFSQALGRRVLDDGEVTNWTRTLDLQGKWLAARHIPYAFVVAPAKWSIYPDRMPWWTRGLNPTHSFDRVLAAAGTLPLIDLRPSLREARNHVETYSALNSHWTDYGGLIAWGRISAELQQRIPSLPALDVPTPASVSISDEGNEFAGMLNVSAANEWTTYRLRQPVPDEAILQPDGSETFLAGGSKTDLLDLPRTVRNDHAGNRLRVLILRDSSGNALSPFFQNAFYLTHQIDHRINSPGTGPDLIGLVDEFRPDLVIWVMTERYFNEPLGDLGHWRDANAYDCAVTRGDTWPQAGAIRSFAANLDTANARLKLELPASSSARILRLDVRARVKGTLKFQRPGQTAVNVLPYGAQRSGLFLRLDASSARIDLDLQGDAGSGLEFAGAELRALSPACEEEAGGLAHL